MSSFEDKCKELGGKVQGEVCAIELDDGRTFKGDDNAVDSLIELKEEKGDDFDIKESTTLIADSTPYAIEV